MKLSKYIVLGAIAIASTASVSCVGDLDIMPENPTTKTEITSADELYGVHSPHFPPRQKPTWELPFP